MQRNKASYKIAAGQLKEIKARMLNWSSRFSILLFLDNNEFQSPYNRFECLLGVGKASGNNNSAKDWRLGHICYDYKNIVEPGLRSAHTAKMGFALSGFFVPETVCYIDSGCAELVIESYLDPHTIYREINNCAGQFELKNFPKLKFSSVIGKDIYIDIVEGLRKHIEDGDCYEINFCNEGFCADAEVAPLSVFAQLTQLSPAPFAAYYRNGSQYMMCASPERYVQKSGDKILSQPMKGTARRDTEPGKDAALKAALRESIKEQAENVMITDLVRNDLARCSEPGTVAVDELFGVYTFPTVHQMISTVSARLRKDITFEDILRATYPMGSMTGAPKFKVMQLIEQYERSRRELFSGTVGYITPDGDFDFNVIIRSLFYNAETRYLCYQTGGAITYDSDPQQEWEETRIKAWALERIFQ